MLKLKLQYFGHLMQRTDSLEETQGFYHVIPSSSSGVVSGRRPMCCLSAVSSVAQSCLTLYDPVDGSPLGSPIPGFLQERTLESVAISFSSA